MSKQPLPAPTASALGPCPIVIQIVGHPEPGSLPRTIAPPDHPPLDLEVYPGPSHQPTTHPWTWKFTQDHRTTRPPTPGPGSLSRTITPPDHPPLDLEVYPGPSHQPSTHTWTWKFTQDHRTTRPPTPGPGHLPRTIVPPDHPLLKYGTAAVIASTVNYRYLEN